MPNEKWLIVYTERGVTKRTRVKSKEKCLEEMKIFADRQPLLMTKWDFEKTYGHIDRPRRQSVRTKSLEMIPSNGIIEASADLQKVVQQEG